MSLRPWQIRKAVNLLHHGQIIAYPTEAVYGIGCDPLNATAVMRLLAIKKRPMQQGLILIASRFEQLEPLLEPLPLAKTKRVFTTWPGPATWVWPAKPEVPQWLRGTHDSLAVRITNHPIASALCEAYGGPIVSTSANISGHSPAHTAMDVQRIFKQQIACIIHGPTGNMKRPTAIRDVASGKILRQA